MPSKQSSHSFIRNGLMIISANKTHSIKLRDGKNMNVEIPMARPMLNMIAFALG